MSSAHQPRPVATRPDPPPLSAHNGADNMRSGVRISLLEGASSGALLKTGTEVPTLSLLSQSDHCLATG